MGLEPGQAHAAKPPPLIMIRMHLINIRHGEGPVPGWHSEAPILRAGPGDRWLADGGSDRSRVTRLPDPAPGPLKRFQARLGTPCAELRISSPSGSTKPNRTGRSPGARWPSHSGRLLWEAASRRFSQPAPASRPTSARGLRPPSHHCPALGCSEASSPASPCPWTIQKATETASGHGEPGLRQAGGTGARGDGAFKDHSLQQQDQDAMDG